jgi:hypothetical protein
LLLLHATDITQATIDRDAPALLEGGPISVEVQVVGSEETLTE